MRTLIIAGALAVAGLGVAGGAAADGGDDCVGVGSPLEAGFYGACLFEENAGEERWTSCWGGACDEIHLAWWRNEAARAGGGQFLGGLGGGGSVAVVQAEETRTVRSTSPWGTSESRERRTATSAAAEGLVLGPTDVLTMYAIVAAGQNHQTWEHCPEGGACRGRDSASTYAIVVVRVLAWASVGWGQHAHDDGCEQHVALATSAGNLAPPPPPCAAVVPQLADDPATRFPDWPDGTGLPFL